MCQFLYPPTTTGVKVKRVSAKYIIKEDPKLLAQDPAKLRRELPNVCVKPKTKRKRKQQPNPPTNDYLTK